MVVVSDKQVLVVEDERVVAKDLQLHLERLGYQVPYTAASADEAIRLASHRCPDVVLMDIRIKGERDGIEVAEILRERFDVPVVYLTAYADDETMARAQKTQPHGYLIKPVKLDELRTTLEIALYRHEMERRLRERERWFSTTLRSIGDAVVSTDAAGLVTFMNPVAETLTGIRLEKAKGVPLGSLFRFVDQQTRAAIDNPIERALREGQVIQTSAAVEPTTSAEPAVTQAASAIVDDAGDVLGAVLVFRDVSEQRRLQRQAELADRLASLGTIAAGIAHEVNNPLACIVANLRFVLDEVHSHRAELGAAPWLDESLNALTEADEASARVARIVSDLRLFSHPVTSAPRRSDPRRALEWALSIVGHQLYPRARVVKDLRDVPAVLADETRLGQVFVNLLVNAAQALPPDKPDENEVRVSTETDETGRVVAAIKDTGAGMTEEVKKRIFDPFFTTRPRGTAKGLGLSICHGIVGSLGGEISVESQPGRGSTFRVALPPAPPEETPQPQPARAPRAASGARILIIDDEPLVSHSMRRLLENRHTVTIADSAGDGLALIEQGLRYDLILCDLMMPGMTGIDFHEELLRLDPEQARRMVVVTGGAYTTRAWEFLRSSTNPRLQKPFSPLELEGLVSELSAAWGPAVKR